MNADNNARVNEQEEAVDSSLSSISDMSKVPAIPSSGGTLENQT